MKGVLFTELIEMMEDLMGLEFTNKVIDEANLENQGAYTSIGYYQYQDLLKLLDGIGKYIENPQSVVLKSYGEYFFQRTSAQYPTKIDQYKNTFSFLKQAPQILNQEIRKLEPTASIPEITTEYLSQDSMKVLYYSEEKMSYLLEGLIMGCIGYFQEPIFIKRENLNQEQTKVRFVLQKVRGYERN